MLAAVRHRTSICSPGCWEEKGVCVCGDDVVARRVSLRGTTFTFSPVALVGGLALGTAVVYALTRKRKRKRR